jgi:hypothetical protein
MIYLLTAVGLTPGGSITVHVYTKSIHRSTKNKKGKTHITIWKSWARELSLRVLPWHLTYNKVKRTGKPQSL